MTTIRSSCCLRPAMPARFCSFSGEAARLELPVVVARVQNRYDQAKDFQARFTQKYSRQVVGRVTVSAGHVHFKKPGRMRWTYEQARARVCSCPTGRCSGCTSPRKSRRSRQDLKTSQLPAALAFLMGRGKIGDEFEVAWSNDTRLGRPETNRLVAAAQAAAVHLPSADNLPLFRC